MATKDETLIPAASAQLARADRVPEAALDLLSRAAISEGSDELTRANCVIALSKLDTPLSAKASLEAMAKINQEKLSEREFTMAKQAFLRSKNSDQLQIYESEAAKLQEKKSAWADAVLLRASENKSFSPGRDAAMSALEEGWKKPERRIQILNAIALSENRAGRERVLEAVNDPDPRVAQAAIQTAKALRIEKQIAKKDAASGPLIEKLSIPDTIAQAVKTKGNVRLGEELFTRQGCVGCHTVTAEQPLRGPFLGNIATIYKRDELATAILIPNKTIAQGFATHHFELKDGTDLEGFVTQEAAEKVIIRNVAAQEIEIPTKDIAKRSRLEKSLMPEGLVANLSVQEFASLLDYLQSLARKDH